MDVFNALSHSLFNIHSFEWLPVCACLPASQRVHERVCLSVCLLVLSSSPLALWQTCVLLFSMTEARECSVSGASCSADDEETADGEEGQERRRALVADRE